MMKRPDLGFAIAVIVSVVSSTTHAGLVGHWTFNEGFGTTAHDSANGHHGTVHGATWTNNGKLRFDGEGDHVQVPDAPTLDLTVFTLDVRFQVNALPSFNTSWTILSKGEDPSTDHANYYLTVVNSNAWGPAATKIACVFESHSDYNYWLMFDIDESYVHRTVRVTSTLEGNDWKMYLDGSRVPANIYLNDRDNPITLSGQIPATGTSPLFFGAFSRSSGFYSGLIDDVRIYDHALSEAEIATVPVPSSILLGVLGLVYAGTRLCRRR